jgi:hypothetical protein
MHKERHVRIRGSRRSEPNLQKLSRALIALAQAQAEKEAEAQHRPNRRPAKKQPRSKSA